MKKYILSFLVLFMFVFSMSAKNKTDPDFAIVDVDQRTMFYSVDGNVLKLNEYKKAMKLEEGFHDLLVFYNDGRMKSENTFLRIFVQKGKSYTIRAHIDALDKCFFIIFQDDMLIEKVREWGTFDIQSLEKEIEVFNEFPEGKDYEVISIARYQIDTTAGARKKITDEMILNRFQQMAIKNGADAIVNPFYYTASNPNWQKNVVGYFIRYK